MKKLLGLSALVIGILVLSGGGYLLYRLSQFRSEVATLQTQGFPVSFADLGKTSDEIQVDGTGTLNRLVSQLASFEKEMFEDQDVLNRPVDDEMIERFRELEQAYPNVFPLIEELSQADDLSFEFRGDFQPAINEELDRVQNLRSCARVLSWKMRVLAAEQKPDEALAAGLQIFQLCRVFGSQPTLVARLVRVASQGIAIAQIHELITNHEISSESRDRLNREFELTEAADDYLQSLITERACGIEYVSQMGIFHMANSGKGYLDAINDEIENCQKQPFEQNFEFEANYSSLRDGWAAGSILPAFQQLRRASARTTSYLRALRIINELVAHPEATDREITPLYLIEIGVPEAMTIDTMTGDPMKIKRFDDRWVVYSVGWNRRDDGGDSNPATGDFSLGLDEEE